MHPVQSNTGTICNLYSQILAQYAPCTVKFWHNMHLYSQILTQYAPCTVKFWHNMHPVQSNSGTICTLYSQILEVLLLCNSRIKPVPVARDLRRRSTAARLLRSRVRIPPGAWMSDCCECVVCCQVEVSATYWSLVQRSPTDCGVSMCVIKKPRKRGGYSPVEGCKIQTHCGL